MPADEPTTLPADHARRMRARFRDLLAGPRTIVMPGGFSPLYARAAELAGFESFFVAGSQMSAYLLGVPDAGILGQPPLRTTWEQTSATVAEILSRELRISLERALSTLTRSATGNL